MPKHAITGCRVDTLFDGLWLVQEQALENWVSLGWAIVEKGELQAYSQKSATMAEAADERPFVVKDGIARLNVSGPLTKHDTSMSSLFGGTSTFRLRESLRQIRQEADSGNIKAVFIDMDSGGGTAEGTPEAAAAIRKTAEMIPVHVHAEDKACSAALYMGVSGTSFSCGPAAHIGSVGTILKLWDRSGKQDGSSKPVVFKTGSFKGMGSSDLPMTQEQKDELQRMVNSINDDFVGWVQKERNLSEQKMADIKTARIYIGKQAVDIGLCDRVCTTDEALQNLKQQISDKAEGRGPALKVSLQAAPTRSAAMPFSASQLEAIRKLPGAANATAENAADLVISLAQQGVQTGTAGAEQLVNLRQENSNLRTELAQLKAQIPQPMAAHLLAGHLDLTTKQVDFALKAGQILPAQRDALLAAFKDKDGKPVEAALASPLLPVVLDVLAINKPNGLLQDISKAQPAPQTEPGNAPKPQKLNLEQFNELRVSAGLAPLTPKEWKERNGE